MLLVRIGELSVFCFSFCCDDFVSCCFGSVMTDLMKSSVDLELDEDGL